MRTFFLCALLLIIGGGAALAALPAPRPYSGCGVLILRQGGGWQPEALTLYQEPGVLRVAEKTPASLPRLAGSDNEPLLSVTERRGGWVSIALDDAGRQGWLEQARAWEYSPWREFLPGRALKLLPGLKKEWYQLLSAPGASGSLAGTLSRNQEVRVLQVQEDWVRVEAPSGWLRWRDPDGRLTVSLETRQ